MSKNPQPFLQPKDTHFRKSESAFIRECRKRDLYVDEVFLEECEKHNLLKPVLEISSQRYYDLFQIPIIAKIRKRITKYSEIKDNFKKIKKELLDLEITLPLLYEIRYFYQDKLHNFITTGIIPPFKLSVEEAVKFRNDSVSVFKELKDKFKAKEYSEKYKLSKNKLQELRDAIHISGYEIDPMSGWYPFLRNIRKMDTEKFKQVKGSVLLAHDYYILTELLTYFYKDAFGNNILDPEDIFDGTGGEWKKRNCFKCGKEIKTINQSEKYCIDCKQKVSKTTEASFKCECDEILFRFIEGDEVVNTVFPQRKKPLDLITDIKLDYGKIKIMAQCPKCGKLNMISREKGWY